MKKQLNKSAIFTHKRQSLNVLLKSLMVFLFIASFCFVGCEKEVMTGVNSTNSTLISDKDGLKPSLEQAEEYAQYYLDIYAHFFASLSQNEKFKSELYQEINKQFDGDFNVLTQHFFENNTIMKMLEEHLTQHFPTIDSEELLNAFKGIEGNTYYPQIFIPFFDLDKKSDRGIAVTAGVLESTINLSGFILKDDEIVPNRMLISEEYAQENEVWVISLNENVDDNGQVETPFQHSDFKTIDSEISTMTVSDHKEAWWKGASEVSIRGFFTTFNGLHPFVASNKKYNETFGDIYSDDAYLNGPGYFDECSMTAIGSLAYINPWDNTQSETHCHNYTGRKIEDFKRKWVKKEIEQEVNFTFATDWEVSNFQGQASPTQFIYVIFEKDAWPDDVNFENIQLPTYLEQFLTPFPNQELVWDQIGFRSGNSSYYQGIISGHPDGDTYVFDNPCLEKPDEIEFCIQAQ